MKALFPKYRIWSRWNGKIADSTTLTKSAASPTVTDLQLESGQKNGQLREGKTTVEVGQSKNDLSRLHISNADTEIGGSRERIDTAGRGQVQKTGLNESSLYASIPFLPLPIAIVCFVLNMVIPGSGTVLAGLAIAFVGEPRLRVQEGQHLLSVLINLAVGLFQFGTITFFFVGWFWSVTWGGLLIMHSVAYRKERMANRRQAVERFSKKIKVINALNPKTVARILDEHRKTTTRIDAKSDANNLKLGIPSAMCKM